MVQQLSTNTFTTAKWIVSPTASDGTHTTIQAAINSASSGDTILVRPGTYTENLTLKVGVSLVAYQTTGGFASPSTGNVIINGTCTLSTAGTATITGICLQTNSAAAVAVTGTVASVLILDSCYMNCTNNTGATLSSTSASSVLAFNYCSGDLTTTGIALFANSGAGNVRMLHSSFNNSGGSSTNNTCSSTGNFFPNYSNWANGTTMSSSSNISGSHLDMTMSGNQTGLTFSGTSSGNVQFCVFGSNTSTAITVGSGCSLQLHNCLVSSSNGTTIGGSGTLLFTNLTFNSVASLAGTLTLSLGAMNSFISGAGTGTTGQVLTSNGVSSPPTWQAASGGSGWVLLQSQTASNSATISFTTGISATYYNYVLVFDGVVPVTNGALLQIQYSTNGGSSYVSTGYSSGTGLGSNVGGAGSSQGTSTSAMVIAALNNAANNAGAGTCWLYNLTSGSSASSVTRGYNVGSNLIILSGGLFGNTTSVINAIQLSFSSGNISAGHFHLYGISQ